MEIIASRCKRRSGRKFRRRKLKRNGDKMSVTPKASQQGEVEELSDLFAQLNWTLCPNDAYFIVKKSITTERIETTMTLKVSKVF